MFLSHHQALTKLCPVLSLPPYTELSSRLVLALNMFQKIRVEKLFLLSIKQKGKKNNVTDDGEQCDYNTMADSIK